MSTKIFATGIALLGLATAGPAMAQCAFNDAGKAKGVKVSFVRHYSACPGVTFVAPNSSTMAGVPACTVPTPTSTFRFSAKGGCSVSTGQKLESPCKTGTGIDCSNVSIKGKCGGITESDGVTPISSGVWSLGAVARLTINDNSSGDMTLIDFPVQFAFNPPNKGKLGLKSDTNTLLNNLFGPGSELPGCSSVELVSMSIQDPSGNIFAKVGSATR